MKFTPIQILQLLVSKIKKNPKKVPTLQDASWIFGFQVALLSVVLIVFVVRPSLAESVIPIVYFSLALNVILWVAARQACQAAKEEQQNKSNPE